MKKLFPGYYHPSESEFKELWQKATFVLDANVILNLYRYPSEVSQELINVLDNIKSRIWIPYQVALEYQKNRLKVIADQKKRYSEVTEVLNSLKATLSNECDHLQLKTRHSAIKPDEILNDVNKTIDVHLSKISKLEKKQQSIEGEDKIRLKLDELFKDKIGQPFEQQGILDEIYKEGENRFKLMIPPGYMDRNKGHEKDPEIFSYDNLFYHRKYGDLLVWKQLLNYAKENSIENLIFLTDDDKEDWWLYIKSQGDKKIGPRPELIQEILSFSKVKNFYMYSSEQFLKYANIYFKASVSEESIKQVRNISKIEDKLIDNAQYGLKEIEAESAVYYWLGLKYPSFYIKINRISFPNFIVEDTNILKRIGYEVKFITNPQKINVLISKFLHRHPPGNIKYNIDELNYLFVVEDKESVYEYLKNHAIIKILPEEECKIILGAMTDSDLGENKKIFEPMIALN